MKLSRTAIDLLKANQKIRLLLAFNLDITEDWVNRLIAKNAINSALTLATSVQLIIRETGLSFSQVIEQVETDVQSIT